MQEKGERETRRREKYSHRESRSRNITRVQTIWKGQGLKTLLFCKTTHAGNDSWLQLFEKQGNRRNHNSCVWGCVSVCVCVQDKWVPGTFSVWECSFPPCPLTQSLVLAVAKAQLSGNLSFIFFYFFAQAEASDTILETNCQLPNNQALHLFVRLALK